MKRTNEQVIKFVKMLQNKHDIESECFQTKLANFWIKYDLTDAQVNFLDEVKNQLSGPTEFGLFLNQGEF